MELCDVCEKKIGTEEEQDKDPYEYCTGILTLGPSPYAQEINDDDTEYLMCEGARYESAMDI